MDLNVLSWNATGIMTGIPYLCFLLSSLMITVCGLSEHWLLDENSYIVNAIDPDYYSHTVICYSPGVVNG